MNEEISDKELQRVKKTAFDTGRAYSCARSQIGRGWTLFLDNSVQIETRLSAWKDFEYAYDMIEKIKKEYTVDEHLDYQRVAFIKTHREMCYRYIETMGENGELERLNIHWLKEKQNGK